jgi:hypothetical protein
MREIWKTGLLLCAATVTWAQQDASKTTQAIIEVKYADVNRLMNVLNPLFGGPGGGPVNIRGDSSLHVITVSGSPDTIAVIEKAIKRLDVPLDQPNVDLTVYLISGLAQGQAGDQIPTELDSTVRQLHTLFAYKSYRLADTVVLRGRAISQGDRISEQRAEGVLPGTSLRYSLAYQSINVSAETPRMVHLNNMSFALRGAQTVPSPNKGEPPVTSYSDTPARISTDLDLREGQKTVVGKSSINTAGDALILVIVPKITD